MIKIDTEVECKEDVTLLPYFPGDAGDKVEKNTSIKNNSLWENKQCKIQRNIPEILHRKFNLPQSCSQNWPLVTHTHARNTCLHNTKAYTLIH